MLPVKVIDGLPLDPAVNVSPVVWMSVRLPCVTARLTSTSPRPASGAAIESWLPSPGENGRPTSSFVFCGAGTELTGAWLGGPTWIVTVSGSVRMPPDPKLPWSLVVTERVGDPANPLAGA